MSKNRENITWPAKDGTWNIGFWSFYETASWDSDDYDDEWDVDYNQDSFWWASSGHVSPQAAMNAYTRQHPNPGSSNVWEKRDRANKEELARLDALLWAFQNPKAHAEKVEAENKKALRKRNTTGRAHAKENLTTNKVLAGSYVKVEFITDALYISQSLFGVLARDGDWLTIRDDSNKHHRVFNTATQRLATNILDVHAAKRPSGYGYSRW